MGTAVLFLVLLDVIILFPSASKPRVELAVAVTIFVLAAIAAIWRRNTRLERLAAAGSK